MLHCSGRKLKQPHENCPPRRTVVHGCGKDRILTFNHGVLGSSPSGLTKDNKDFPHKSSIHEMRWAHRK